MHWYMFSLKTGNLLCSSQYPWSSYFVVEWVTFYPHHRHNSMEDVANNRRGESLFIWAKNSLYSTGEETHLTMGINNIHQHPTLSAALIAQDTYASWNCLGKQLTLSELYAFGTVCKGRITTREWIWNNGLVTLVRVEDLMASADVRATEMNGAPDVREVGCIVIAAPPYSALRGCRAWWRLGMLSCASCVLSSGSE